jgi:predicted transcriptional regulator
MWRQEARKLAADGVSWNAIARQLNVSRASVQRYLKSLGVKKTASAEARALIKIRHDKLSGNLDKALREAYELKAVAENKMDTKLLLAANRQIIRILAMQAKATPKLPTDSAVTMKAGVDSRPTQWSSVGIFPEDTDPYFAWRFNGIVKGSAEYDAWQKSLPADKLTVAWEITWRRSPEQLEAEGRARDEASKSRIFRHEAWARLHEAGSSSPSLAEIDAEVLRFEKETADLGPDAIARMDAPHGESK